MGSQPAVCFDLGGVLLRINHTWEEAARAAGVAIRPSDTPRPLNDSMALLRYQASELSEDEYASELAEWLGVTPSEAERVHMAIIGGEYPGAFELIHRLKSAAIWTGCLSNTNALHWRILGDPEACKAIGSLDAKLASHEIGLAKPDPAAYLKVQELLPPGTRIVFFEDTLENVYAAASMGWEVFRIDPHDGPVRQMDEILGKLGVVA